MKFRLQIFKIQNNKFTVEPTPCTEFWPRMVLTVKNDIEVTPGATDGIADMSFSPAADFLAAASWDGQVPSFGLVIVQVLTLVR